MDVLYLSYFRECHNRRSRVFRVYGGRAGNSQSISRRPPQEVAASHYIKGKDVSGRRETTVGESSQSSRTKAPLPRKPVARPMSGRTPPHHAELHARATPQEPINQDREMGFERVEDPSQVQGSALPEAPVPPIYEVTNIGQ